jgi:hypothetical protein
MEFASAEVLASGVRTGEQSSLFRLQCVEALICQESGEGVNVERPE